MSASGPSRRFDLPDLRLGIGLRRRHIREIIDTPPELGFFEVISENALDAHAEAADVLDSIADRYPMVMHGVSLSIGSTDPLDLDYLRALRSLADRLNARWVSDHVCWTGIAGINTHDLLPLPLTEEALTHVVGRVRQASDVLERPLVLENPSTYVTFEASMMPEEEFIGRLAEDADCGILLDVNNVYVSARNHGFDAEAYIDRIPADRVVQVHLAGHEDHGTHVLDTHGGPVIDEVWDLYARFVERAGSVSTLLEWDSDIPPLDRVLAEVKKAERYRRPESCDVAAA